MQNELWGSNAEVSCFAGSISLKSLVQLDCTMMNEAFKGDMFLDPLKALKE